MNYLRNSIDSGRTVWCLDCGQYVDTVTLDDGIGHYEYWGARGVHHAYYEACPKCEGNNFSDEEPEEEDE